jgi:hypothetical protein
MYTLRGASAVCLVLCLVLCRFSPNATNSTTWRNKRDKRDGRFYSSLKKAQTKHSTNMQPQQPHRRFFARNMESTQKPKTPLIPPCAAFSLLTALIAVLAPIFITLPTLQNETHTQMSTTNTTQTRLQVSLNRWCQQTPISTCNCPVKCTTTRTRQHVHDNTCTTRTRQHVHDNKYTTRTRHSHVHDNKCTTTHALHVHDSTCTTRTRQHMHT